MAEKKFERRTVLDPAVADLLTGMEKRQTESQLPRRERERLAKERSKIMARREQRVTYDLPPALRESVRLLSEELKIPASQLVTLALSRFLQDYENEKVDLGKYKQPSHSPRYDWNLVFPDSLIPNGKKKKKTG